MHLGPVLRAAAGIGFLSVMDAVIKGMAAFYPTFQVAFLRFACGALVVTVVVAFMRPGWPTWETIRANALRSVVAVFTASSFFYALGQLPLAETLVLSFLAPSFVALLGMLVLKEPVDGRIVGALAVGFAGTLIVAFGGGEADGPARSWTGVAAALASAVFYAFSVVLLRQRAQLDHYIHIVVFQNVGPMMLMSPLAAFVWTPLHPPHLGWFLVMGVLGVIGHVFLTTAFAKAEAARLAPLEYTSLIWAAGLGYAVFGEIPGLATLLGGTLIIASALMTSRR